MSEGYDVLLVFHFGSLIIVHPLFSLISYLLLGMTVVGSFPFQLIFSEGADSATTFAPFGTILRLDRRWTDSI